MSRFAKRVLLLLVCMMLLVNAALSEGYQFTLLAALDPAQYAGEDRSLWEGAAAFLSATSVTGVVQASDGHFGLSADVTIADGGRKTSVRVHAAGNDTHWRIETPLLGDVPLLVNNASLLEFAVKTNRHLSLPLQRPALLYPYVHTHALGPVFSKIGEAIMPDGEERQVTPEELTALAEWIAAHYEESSALQIWVEAVGTDGDCAHEIAGMLQGLPAYVAAVFPDGLSVTRTGEKLLVCHGETEVASFNRFDGTVQLNLLLPELLVFNLSTHADSVFQTGSLHVASPLLNADLSFSLPSSLPVIYPFYMTLDAEGTLLGGEALHLVLDGEAQGNTILIRQLLPDHSRTAATLTLTLNPVDLPAVAPVDPEDPTLVPVLSMNGDSLAALMAEVRGPLLSGVFDLIRVTPPEACQAAMDLLDDAGVLDVLFTALMNEEGEY